MQNSQYRFSDNEISNWAYPGQREEQRKAPDWRNSVFPGSLCTASVKRWSTTSSKIECRVTEEPAFAWSSSNYGKRLLRHQRMDRSPMTKSEPNGGSEYREKGSCFTSS